MQKLKSDFSLILAKYSTDANNNNNNHYSSNDFQHSSPSYAKANHLGGSNVRRSKSIDVPR